MRNGSGELAGASAVRRSAGPCRSVTPMVVGPMSKRLEIRLDVKAAIMEPTADIESTSPIRPGESPSSRMRYTTTIEMARVKKKFEDASASSLRAQVGIPEGAGTARTRGS